jgi:predicted hydrocarbon binding protein
MPVIEPPLRLKGNLYGQPGYFKTDVAKGVTRTPTGQRICTLPSEFMLGFRDALIYECGKAYRKVMKAAGKKWGVRFAARFDKDLSAAYQAKLRDLPAGLVHTCLADAFAANGYGRLEIDLTQCDSGIIIADVRDPVMPSLVREADRPVDLLTAGMLGSVFTHLIGESVDAIQTECPSLGADRSRFVLARTDAIVAAEEFVEASEQMPTHEAILDRVRRTLAA